MTKFKVFTNNETKLVPKHMVLIKDDKGWLYLENENTQWFVNHTNTYDSSSKESDEAVIKAIVKQVKINKKVLKENETKS